MLESYKKKSITAMRAKDMSPEELTDRIIVGEFVDIEKPEMIERLAAVREKAMAENRAAGDE
jgi:2-oxoglutarate ferredoxin oxidoreductase subunit beta